MGGLGCGKTLEKGSKLAISSLSGVVTVAAPLITSTLGSTGNSQKQDSGEMYKIAV